MERRGAREAVVQRKLWGGMKGWSYAQTSDSDGSSQQSLLAGKSYRQREPFFPRLRTVGNRGKMSIPNEALQKVRSSKSNDEPEEQFQGPQTTL